MGRFNLTRPEPPAAAPAPDQEPDAPVEAAAPPPAAPPPSSGPPPILARDPEAEMLDLKLRLHGRLIEELDLSKLEKLEDGELRRQVMNLVSDFARGERLVLNTAELEK